MLSLYANISIIENKENKMGLDTVEFLVKIEVEYDISIPDEDAYLLGEVGDLALYIVNACEQNNGVLIELEPVLDFLKNMLHIIMFR